MRHFLIWVGLLAIPIFAIALTWKSPLLQWREPVYISAGFAGVLGLVFLMFQPLLILGVLPGVKGAKARRIHKAIGLALVLSVLLHIFGLWLTSPPDVVDALLFASPTWFAPFGVVAMWAVFAAALMVVFRKVLRLPPRLWRRVHLGLAVTAVVGTIMHAVLIDGTMELYTKVFLCLATGTAMGALLHSQRDKI
ncbi:MAG: ferric reductase-like transmembrane domain-containing protein [Pseudomonadota bacterium]